MEKSEGLKGRKGTDTNGTGMPVIDFINQPKGDDPTREDSGAIPDPLNDDKLQTVLSIVKKITGNDFSSYKKNTILRRIERRIAANCLEGIDSYISFLEENEQEANNLCREFLIGVTSFFRDPEAFEVIDRDIIPRLFADRGPENPLRIWHACCSTGEEVYSMAILIREYLDKHGLDADLQVFATDIDEAAIARARTGLYTCDACKSLGEKRLETFFTRCGENFQVKKALRELLVFASHNMLKDPPFSRIDLLVCRNCLIYLNPGTQEKLISMFHRALNPGGFLFLGNSETKSHARHLFIPIDKKWKIFQRREYSRIYETVFPFSSSVPKLPAVNRQVRNTGAAKTSPGDLADKSLLERYAPPCVVINDRHEVIHVSTKIDLFLEIPVGGQTTDILRMAREELRPPLRAVIHKALVEQKKAVFRGVKLTTFSGELSFDIVAEPFDTPQLAEKHAMVIFEPVTRDEPVSAATLSKEKTLPLPCDESSKEALVGQLEEQLRITREQLLATIEQLETSNDNFMSTNEELITINEEYQSINEELQATNEEMETSKEELQSLNEELSTINAELRGKVEELDQAGSDMENLLASSKIAVIFLDRKLVIKKFSPAMAGILNLIPADIGRPFRHLVGTLDWTGLPDDARTVLDKFVSIERETASVENGRRYLMRVLPYLGTRGGIDGIVITLLDITELKQVEDKLQRQKAVVEGINRIFREALNSNTEEELGETCLTVVQEITGSQMGFIGETSPDGIFHDIAISDPGWELCAMYDKTGHRRAPGNFQIHGIFGSVLRNGRAFFTNAPLSHPDSIGTPPGHPRLASFLGAPLVRDGRTIGMIGVANRKEGYGQDEQEALEALAPAVAEAFQRKRAEVAKAHLAAIVESSGDAIITKDLNGVILSWNEGAERLFGYNAEDVIGRPVTILYCPDQLEEESAILKRLSYGERVEHYETVRIAQDGREIDVSVTASPIRDRQGRTIGASKIVRDITEQKQAEKFLKTAHNELEIRVTERTEELMRLNEELEEEIRERLSAEKELLYMNRLYRVLSETSHAIVRADDRNALFNDICRIAVEYGEFRMAWIGLVDEDSGDVRPAAWHGVNDGYLEHIRITIREEPEGLGPTGSAIRKGNLRIASDIMNDPRSAPWSGEALKRGYRSSAAIALKLGGKAIGALTMYAEEKDFFTEQFADLLKQMGMEISFALDSLENINSLNEKNQMLMHQNRLAAMGEMISNIAHQWRQPLNTLGLLIQEGPVMLEAGLFSGEYLKSMTEKAMEIIFHMSRTIDDFRNFFRPDKEKVEFNVGGEVRKTLTLLEGSFKNLQIGIEIHEEGTPFIHGYPNEFSQALLNILINARDAFADKKGDRVKVVRIRMFRENNVTVVTIADNAGGIPEEIIDKIFDPYFTTKGPDKGTGIGLYLARAIIGINMGGRLSVRNMEDGAEFRIEI
jgi:PAS domain S-box-containing protein